MRIREDQALRPPFYAQIVVFEEKRLVQGVVRGEVEKREKKGVDVCYMFQRMFLWAMKERINDV
jgi:hypothetical protein